jgi:hypothetical protein
MTLSALGIFSAAGASAAVAGASYEWISTATGTGLAATISFTSIPQDYKHLQIRYAARVADTGTNMFLTANGVGGTSYASHRLTGVSSAVASSAFTSQPYINLQSGLAGSAATAGVHQVGIIDLLDYTSTSKNKTFKALFGGSEQPQVISLTSGVFVNTSAVSSLTFTSSGPGNYTTSTRFSLYGIKG